MTSNTDFPAHRKYSNNASYFRIGGPEEFMEVKVLAKTYSIHHFKATTLPDRVFIADMLSNEGGHWEVIEAAEFDAFLANCKANFKEMPGS